MSAANVIHCRGLRLALWTVMAVALAAGCGREPASPQTGGRPSVSLSPCPPLGLLPATLRVDQLTEMGRDPVPSLIPCLSVQTGDGHHVMIPPSIQLIRYEYPLTDPDTGKPGRMLLNCCLISSGEPRIKWRWSVWEIGDSLFWHFRLFPKARGGYVAWMHVREIWLAEIVKPKDEAQSLAEFAAAMPCPPGGVVAVPVIKLLGTKPFPLQPTGPDMTPVALTRNAAGNYELQIVGSDPNRIFTIVGDGTRWRVK